MTDDAIYWRMDRADLGEQQVRAGRRRLCVYQTRVTMTPFAMVDGKLVQAGDAMSETATVDAGIARLSGDVSRKRSTQEVDALGRVAEQAVVWQIRRAEA